MRRALLAFVSAALVPAWTAAQTPPSGAAPASDAKPAEKPWYSVLSVGGSVDAYYLLRLDASQGNPVNLRSYDTATGFTLNDAVISLSMKPEPVGFHVDLQFGNEATIIDQTSAASAGATTPTFGNHVLQGYVDMKLKAVELNAGRLVQLSGAETPVAKDNWLYSRSLLFSLEPTTVTGVRFAVPVKENVTIQAGVNNGWDVVSANDSGKTGEFQIAFTGPNATTAAATVYFGPNPTLFTGARNTSDIWRVLVDGVLGTTIAPFAINLNVDYGTEHGKNYWGIAGMARWSAPKDWVRFTGRFEYVQDRQGVRFATSTETNVWELTAGASFPVASNGELRAEFRYDHATEPVFAPAAKDQATGTLAALAWF